MALVFAGIFLVTALSVYFYAKTDHARHLLVNKINTAIPGTLSAEDITVSFINSYVKLDGIQINDQANIPCFKFESLLLDVKISSLFDKVLEITLFRVDSPEISLIIDAKGRINLIDALMSEDKVSPEKEATQKESKGLPINVIVKETQIVEGAVTVKDPKNRIQLNSLNIDVMDINLLEKSLSLSARLKNSRIKQEDKEILIETFSFLSELEQGSTIDFDLDLDSDLGVIKAKGSAADIIKAPSIDLNITARSNLENVNAFLGDKAAIGGLVNMTLSGKGPVNNPEVTLNLDVTDLVIDEDIKGDRVNLSARLEDRTFTVNKGFLNILGTDLEFKGFADLKQFFPKGFLSPEQNPDGLEYDFSFDQKSGDFQHFAKWLKGFSGRFSSSGKIAGKGINPETLAAGFQFNLALEDFKQDKPGTDFLDLETDIKGTIEKGLCRISRFNARTGDTEIDATGQYEVLTKMIAAELSAVSKDLSSLTRPLGLPPVKGSIDSKLSVAGNSANPEMKVTLTGKDLSAQGILVNDIQFKGAMNSSGKAIIEQFAVKDQDLVFEVKGSAQVFEKGFKLKDNIKAELLLSGKNIRPGRFIEPSDINMTPEQLDSLINFNLDLDLAYKMGGSMDKIDFSGIEFPVKNIAARIDIEKKDVFIALEKYLNLTASLDTKNNQYKALVRFDNSDLVPLFKLVGINNIKTRIDGEITAEGNIPVALPENVVKELNAARGSITFDADMKGSLKAPDFNVKADLSNLSYHLDSAGIKISNLNGSLVATPDKVDIKDLKTQINEGLISLNGHFGLNQYKVQDASLSILADGIDIPIPSKTGAKESIAIDKFDTDLNVTLQYGTETSAGGEESLEKQIPIKTIQAALDLNKFDLSVLVDETMDMMASFDPDNSIFDLNLKFNDTLLGPLLKTAGMTGVKGRLRGHMISRGKLNLSLPPDVVNGLKQATGELNFLANVKGSLEKPDLDAVVTLKGLGYPIPEIGMTLANLNGKASVSKNGLEINNIVADLGKGNLSVDGKIDLEAYKPVKGNIKLKAENIVLELPDMARVEFGYDLTFSGTQEKSDLFGTFLMQKGEYYKDISFDLLAAVGDKKRQTISTGEKKTTGVPMIDKTKLNIDVDYKKPFTVDNNLAFIQIGPNVKIEGTPVNPVVTGRAKILKGTIVYQKREFEIEKGIIDFVDPYKIDPDVNLKAVTQIRDWNIRLEISGKTDNLKFLLFSEPYESHQDILSLILLGKTTKELGKSEGGSYKGILADKASDVIGQSVQDATPLDSFKLGYDDSASDDPNVSVTMGKKLSKRLEVIYGMKIKNEETVHTSAAEYKALENFILKAFNDSKGDYGAGVTYKLEFR